MPPGSPPPAGGAVEGPVQIITVSGDGTGMELHESRLLYVLRQVPPGLPVAVVSVVGAFRTGKSFILDIFLRYLRWSEEHGQGAWSGVPAAARRARRCAKPNKRNPHQRVPVYPPPPPLLHQRRRRRRCV